MSKKFTNETQFINETNFYFSVFHDFSRYSIDLQNADLSTKGIWISLLALLFPKDGRLVDWRGNKMQDEKAAEYLRIPLEQFKPALESLENWGVFQRDEDGVLFNRWLIKQTEKMKSDREAGAIRAKKWRDGQSSSNNNSERNAYVRERNANVTPERREKQNKKNEMKGEGKSTAPGGVNPPPVDNSTHSAAGAALSLTYQDSSYRSEIEALANLIETTTTAGECNGIGESARRQAIYYQSEKFPASDSAVWFNAMTEAISCAQPGTRQYELLTALRKYPDGILDSGNVSRSEELIRLTAQKPNCGACSKALDYIHGKQGKTTPLPSNSPGNEEEDNQNNLF